MAGMRRDDQQPDAMFSYISPEERVPKDHPLRPIRQLVDEILRALSRDFDALYSKVGRPSIPPNACCGRSSSRSSIRSGASGC